MSPIWATPQPSWASATTGPATFERGVLTFEGAGEAGPVAVRLSCTPFPLNQLHEA